MAPDSLSILNDIHNNNYYYDYYYCGEIGGKIGLDHAGSDSVRESGDTFTHTTFAPGIIDLLVIPSHLMICCDHSLTTP